MTRRIYTMFFSNNQSTAISPLKQGFHGKYFLNDLEYIAQASQVGTSMLEKDGLQFALRGMDTLCYICHDFVFVCLFVHLFICSFVYLFCLFIYSLAGLYTTRCIDYFLLSCSKLG
jgi:hypothetical protein